MDTKLADTKMALNCVKKHARGLAGIAALFFAFACSSSYAQNCPTTTTFSGGSGTSSSPYGVETLCQLQRISSDVTTLGSHYIQIALINAASTRDWYDAKGFDPIGARYEGNNPATGTRTLDVPFTGSFNGNNFRISNLYINRPDEDYVGLFARAESATLTDIELTSAIVTGSTYVGTLAGVAMDGAVITDADVSGTVTASMSTMTRSGAVKPPMSDPLDRVPGVRSNGGGLVGLLSGEGSVIRNANADVNVYGLDTVGGLVGRVEEGASVEGASPSERTIAEGNVYGDRVVGGLIGIVDGASVSNVTATGDINNLPDVDVSIGSRELGGLIGRLSNSSVDNGAASGGVSAGGHNAGGLVGYAEGSTIMDSEASGDVTVDPAAVSTRTYGAGGLVAHSRNSYITAGQARGNVSGERNVGGLVGFLQDGSIIANSWATGQVDSYKEETSGNQSDAAGGLVGNVLGNATTRALITGSYAEGTVTGTLAGGLVGMLTYGEISASYASRPVEASNTNGLIAAAGGLVAVALTDASISDSYAWGSVASTSTGVNGSDSGGIVARIVTSGAGSEISIKNSYARGVLGGGSRRGGLIALAVVNPEMPSLEIVSSYAREAPGVTPIAFTIDAASFTPVVLEGVLLGGSGLRSLAQLQCPEDPGVECMDATTYQGWSLRTWSLGDRTQLPVLNTLKTSIEAPTSLAANWAATGRLTLSWTDAVGQTGNRYAIGFPNLGSTIARSITQSSTSYEIDVRDLRAFRAANIGGAPLSYTIAAVERAVDMASIGAEGDGMFTLLDVPGAPPIPTTVTRGATTAVVTIERTTNDGYGRSGAASGTTVDEILSLDLVYSAQIYYREAGGNYTNDISVAGSSEEAITTGNSVGVSVSGLLANFPYVAIPAARSIVGISDPGMPLSFMTQTMQGATPTILDSSGVRPQPQNTAVTMQVNEGALSGMVTLRARSADGTTLTWSVFSTPAVGSTVNIGANTSSELGESEVDVTYSVAGGIRRDDSFIMQVGSLSTTVTDKVRVDIEVVNMPIIEGSTQRTLQIGEYAAMSEALMLVATDGDTAPSDLAWFVNGTAPTNDEVALDSGAATVRITITSSTAQSIATVVFLHVPGTISTNSFTVEVRDDAISFREASVEVKVETARSIGPVILEAPQTLSIARGETKNLLDFTASDPDVGKGDILTWTLDAVSVSTGSQVAFLSGSGTVNMIRGATDVSVQFTRPENSLSTGTFVVKVADVAGLFDTARVVIVNVENTSPVITEFAGEAIEGVDSLIVFLAPGTQVVTLRAVATDAETNVRLLSWETTITETNSIPSMSSTASGGTNAISYTKRGSTPATLLTEVSDPTGLSDRLNVSLIESSTPPMIVSIAIGGGSAKPATATTRVNLSRGEDSANITLYTQRLWADPRWEATRTVTTTMDTVSPESDPSGRSAEFMLSLPANVLEATFTVTVSVGSGANVLTSDPVTITLIGTPGPPAVIGAPLRLRMFLGGAIR